jgi:hypothetical protein
MQLLCIQGAIVIRIGGVETLLDNGKILVLRERAIMVGIGHSQLLGRQEPSQFMLVQRAVLVAFQSVKASGRRLLRFREVDRTIIVGIECLDRAGVIWLRRSW